MKNHVSLSTVKYPNLYNQFKAGVEHDPRGSAYDSWL